MQKASNVACSVIKMMMGILMCKSKHEQKKMTFVTWLQKKLHDYKTNKSALLKLLKAAN